MKLSIMFITYNRKEELQRAIQSCLKYKIEGMEFIIVDNNSNDGTEETIKKLLEDENCIFTYHYSEQNLGVAGGRNKGFEICRGEYIFCLDDDAIIVSEEIFKKSCALMDEKEYIGALAYNIYEPSTNKYILGYFKKSDDNEITKCLSYCGGAHMLRRNIFKKNIYPNNLFFGSEELYASNIIYDNNCIVMYCKGLKVHHLPSKVNRVQGKQRDYNLILNQYIIKLLNYPRIIIPIVSLVFSMRLFKNKLLNKDTLTNMKLDFSKRYNENEVYRISYKCFFGLIRKFGLAKVL